MTEAEYRELADYRYTVVKMEGRQQWVVKDMTRTLDTNVAIFHRLGDAVMMRDALAQEFLNSRGVDLKISAKGILQALNNLRQHVILNWSGSSAQCAHAIIKALIVGVQHPLGLHEAPADPFTPED